MPKPRISLIAAIAQKDRGIGRNNKLLWNIPADLKRFRQTTSGHPVVMGRKTFESIGKPLPHRLNIVISRDSTYTRSGVTVVHALDEAIKVAGENNQNEIFIIGGSQIYAEAIKRADRLYLTLVAGDYTADTFFPPYTDFSKVIFEQKHFEGGHELTYLTLEKESA